MIWKEIRIKDIGRIITGTTPPTAEKKYFDGKYPFIKPSDLNKDERTPSFTEMTISEEGLGYFPKNLLPKHTSCIVTIGTIGKLCFTDKPSFTNQQINSVIPNQDLFDNHFVYYLLMMHIPSVKVLNGGSASGRENVNKSSFSNIKVKVPNLRTQKKIGSILSSYDELIENNKQRIKLLEEMAEEIYKEWFVRLRFPGYENTKILDGLPVGWENGTIGGLVEFKKGKNITLDTVSEGNVPVVAGGLTPAYYHNVANTISPTITISASGANAGFVNLYYEDVWASDCSFLDSKSTDTLFFFYLTLKTRQKEVFFLQKGSAQPHVYPKDIMTLKMKIPSNDLIEKFEDLVVTFFEEIKILSQKNQLLQETRDLLLPRLISGKLSVEHLVEKEEALGMVAEPSEVYGK